MADENWERVQKERIKRLNEEYYRKAKGAELAQKEEEQNEEFKKAALKHIAEKGSSEGLFYKEKPSLNNSAKSLKNTTKSIKKGFKQDKSSLLDKIKEKIGL